MEGLPRIDEVYVVIVTDKDGTEGIAGMHTAEGWMPFVVADKKGLERVLPIARMAVRRRGVKAQLVRFTQRQCVEDF